MKEKENDRLEWEQVQEYLGSLASKGRQIVIDAAIDDEQNSFIRSRVVRYLDDPKANSDSDMYFEMALRNHVLPLLRPPVEAGSLF